MIPTGITVEMSKRTLFRISSTWQKQNEYRARKHSKYREREVLV